MFSRLNNLRFKIIGWSFIPAAIILSAVALLTFESYQQVTEDLVVNRNQELTRLQASQLASELNGFTDLLEAEARTALLYRGLLAEQQTALENAHNRLAVFDGGVVVLDSYGKVRASEPNRPALDGQDWSNQAVFRNLLSDPRPVFSDLIPIGPGGSNVVAVAVPILGEQAEFRGVLIGMFRSDARNISAFYGNLVRLRLGGEGEAYLIDGNGRVLYHSDTSLIGRDLSNTHVVQLALAGTTNAVRTTDASGQTIVASYAPVPGTTWRLVKEESWSALIGAAVGFRQFLLILLALGLLIPVVVVAIGVDRITTPLEDLIQAAKEVAEGNFGRKIVADTGDELETLAVQFNRMSAQLQDSVSNLEQRVADRTRELEALNAIARTASQSLDRDELLNTTLDKVLEVLGFKTGMIILKDPATDALRRACVRGMSEEFQAKLGTGRITSQVAHTGEMRVVQDLRQEGESQAVAVAEGYRSVAAVPLISKGRVLGVLSVAARRQRVFSPQDKALLQSIGNQIGVAIENALLYERAQQMATIEERQRIARELHDAVSQTLFASSMLAEVLPVLWTKDPEEGQRRLEELRELTRGAQAEMRTLLLELRPATLAETDMADLLKQLSEAVVGRARIDIDVDVAIECPVPTDVKIALYRIAQEALNNTAKHAGASRAAVRFTCREGRATLDVHDDGRGFNPDAVPAGRLGLGIMAERASEVGAELSLDVEPGEGTHIRVIWVAPEGYRMEAAGTADAEPSPDTRP